MKLIEYRVTPSVFDRGHVDVRIAVEFAGIKHALEQKEIPLGLFGDYKKHATLVLADNIVGNIAAKLEKLI